MHIADGFLSKELLATGIAVSGFALFLAIKKIGREFSEKKIPLLGIMASFIFAIQLISIPVYGGTTVHLSGAILSVYLLGPFSSFVIIFTTLLLQTLLFQHGGVLSLGVNLFNLGVIPCLLGGLIFKTFRSKYSFLLLWFLAFLAPVLSATFCAIELSISGLLPLPTAIIPMVVAHVISGFLEAILTVSIVKAIKYKRPDLLELNKI